MSCPLTCIIEDDGWTFHRLLLYFGIVSSRWIRPFLGCLLLYCGKSEIFLRRKFLNRVFFEKPRNTRPRVRSYAGQAANLANDSRLALDTNANSWVRDSARPAGRALPIRVIRATSGQFPFGATEATIFSKRGSPRSGSQNGNSFN